MSLDTLSAADENEKSDIYEFEQVGSGSCSEESRAFDSASGGCHFLISSGKSEDESYLVDASASGATGARACQSSAEVQSFCAQSHTFLISRPISRA